MENFFIRNNNPEEFEVVLGDFGLSIQIQRGQLLKDHLYSQNYAAPEQIKGVGYSFPADIYALSVSIGAILSIIKEPVPYYLLKLVEYMSVENPKERPDIDQVLSSFERYAASRRIAS